MARESFPDDELTEDEKGVIKLLAQGRSGDEIAAELEITGETVRSRVQSILTKLQVRSRLEAATWAKLLANLLADVNAVGSGTSLADKVAEAQAYLANNDVAGTCLKLSDFISQAKAQSGKAIPTATASALILDAERIRTALSC